MFKVLEKGCEPTRGSKYSACVDLYASEEVYIKAGETKLVGLGVSIDADWMIDSANIFYSNDGMLPKYKLDHFMKTHYLQLMLRSSLGKKGLILPNGVGIIDLDYQDEIKMIIYNPVDTKQYVENGQNYTVLLDSDDNEVCIKKGDKIAQITLLEHKSYLFGIDTDKEREGGFGSTGK